MSANQGVNLFSSEAEMKKSKKKQVLRKRSETDWQGLTSKYKRSGLSQSEFCRSEDIKLSTFSYWLYRGSKPEGSGGLFCEVTAKKDQGFEVEKNGFRVKVPSNFRPEALKALLEVVGAP